MRSAMVSQVASSAPGSTAISSYPPYRAARSISRRVRATHLPSSKHLIAHAVPEIIVEPLEMVDVDQQDTGRVSFFHRHFCAVRKNSSRARRFGRPVTVSVLARLLLCSRIAVVSNSRVFSTKFFSRCARGGFRQLASRIPRQVILDDAGFAPVSDITDCSICERVSAMATVRNCLAEAITEWRYCETFLRAASSASSESI